MSKKGGKKVGRVDRGKESTLVTNHQHITGRGGRGSRLGGRAGVRLSGR